MKFRTFNRKFVRELRRDLVPHFTVNFFEGVAYNQLNRTTMGLDAMLPLLPGLVYYQGSHGEALLRPYNSGNWRGMRGAVKLHQPGDHNPKKHLRALGTYALEVYSDDLIERKSDVKPAATKLVEKWNRNIGKPTWGQCRSVFDLSRFWTQDKVALLPPTVAFRWWFDPPDVTLQWTEVPSVLYEARPGVMWKLTRPITPDDAHGNDALHPMLDWCQERVVPFEWKQDVIPAEFSFSSRSAEININPKNGAKNGAKNWRLVITLPTTDEAGDGNQ